MSFQGMSESDWVALGRSPHVIGLHIAGQSPTLSGSSDIDLWNGGSDWVAPTEARIHNIVSDEDEDTLLGTGARTVFIIGLNAQFDIVGETINMAGTTIVPTTKSYIRIIRMLVVSGGGAGEAVAPDNLGTITATAQVDDTVTAEIRPGKGSSLMAIFTVPAGRTFLINKAYAELTDTMVVNKARMDALLLKRQADDKDASWQVLRSLPLDQSYDPAIPLPEKMDVKIRIIDIQPPNIGALDNAMIRGGFHGKLVRG
jgi:hypothetical protein